MKSPLFLTLISRQIILTILLDITNSEDPNSNDVKYFINCGDGNTEWTDYYASVEDITVKLHRFSYPKRTIEGIMLKL